MSPQGGLVADAKLQGHDRRHGQTREREVEDARAALWHVDVEARRHDRAVTRPPVHCYRDRAVRRPQERHLVAQPPDVNDGKLPATPLASIERELALNFTIRGSVGEVWFQKPSA